jgi:hypothetical protein
MGEPQEAGAAASPRKESPAERAGVILTPDQRVRVFISSTLEELAPERAAARASSQSSTYSPSPASQWAAAGDSVAVANPSGGG